MAHRWKNDLTRADATPYAAFLNRRQLMGGALGLGLIGAAGVARAQEELVPNPWEDITQYNNFYEFGTRKEDPARYAHTLTTAPWSVKIDGLVDNPGDYSMEQILEAMTIEERIYRFRCVEAWSMVIPWNGFELADLLTMAGVQEGAKYVAFETALRPDEMPGLLVPWNYGFISIKPIVRITVSDDEPPTSWNKANGRENGFYSNVNPNVDHPRWSQASERVVGGGLFARRQPTLMFNGYEDEVASLYEGMDLSVFF